MHTSDYIKKYGGTLDGKVLLYLSNHETMAQAWDACTNIDILEDLLIGAKGDVAPYKAFMLKMVGKYTIPKDWRGDFIRQWIKESDIEHVVLVAMMFVSESKTICADHTYIVENVKQCGNPYLV
jgi:hypothetical protein